MNICTMDSSEWANEANRVMTLAAEAITRAASTIEASNWELAVSTILRGQGKLVLTGIGKSGAIGKKLASTFASTGTQAVFMHPSEALHGDLGVLASGDVIMALSYSGETDELRAILPSIAQRNIPIIALTSRANSSLGRASRCVLQVEIVAEACPMNLAPTTSTSVMLAVGDAIALTVMQARAFTRDDYARLHPSGSLGRRLTLHVSDIMRTGDSVAIVFEEDTVIQTVLKITNAHAGAAIVVDQDGAVCGLVTDGDIRRHLLLGEHVLTSPTRQIMNSKPGTVEPDVLAVDALKLLESFHPDPGSKAGEAPVVGSDNRPLGMLMLKDIVQAGIGV